MLGYSFSEFSLCRTVLCTSATPPKNFLKVARKEKSIVIYWSVKGSNMSLKKDMDLRT